MNLVILGSGNVAHAIGLLAKNAGHTISQVFSRQLEHATILAKKLDAEPVSNWTEITTEAQLFIVALSDGATEKLSSQFKLSKGLVVHTAGALNKNVLINVALNYGVLYPLQTIRAEKLPEGPLPLLVDANTADNIVLITAFAETISSTVRHCSDEDRKHLHLSAVLVNNFTNHLYFLAAQYCQKNKVDFNLLLPLIQETATRVQHLSPAEAQTGPAIRNDQETIERHVQLLAGNPKLEAIYQLFTESIIASLLLNQHRQ